MNVVELLGWVASLTVVGSMVFKTSSLRGTIWMRIINIIGSIFFVIYGVALPAYATAVTNLCLIFVHLFLIYKELHSRDEALHVKKR